MKCVECVRLGLKSTLHGTGGYSTLLNHDRFYDEEGALHIHDPNSTRSEMTCSNGHKLRMVTFDSCRRCSYRGGEDVMELVAQGNVAVTDKEEV